MTSRSARPIARPALSGASSGSTRGYAPGTRRKPRFAPMRPRIFRRRIAGNGAARASPPRRCRSARIAPTASTGAGPTPDSAPSTGATCPRPGGGGPESATVTRLAPFPSLVRDRSGAQLKARTFAPRACREAARSIRRRADGKTAPYPAATPRRMIPIASAFARSNALSSSGPPPFKVAISCAALAYCWVVAQII